MCILLYNRIGKWRVRRYLLLTIHSLEVREEVWKEKEMDQELKGIWDQSLCTVCIDKEVKNVGDVSHPLLSYIKVMCSY